MTGDAAAAGRVLGWLAGPLVWSAHFLVVYASESVLCGGGAGASAHRALFWTATGAAAALLLLAAWHQARRPGPAERPGNAFMRQTALGLTLLSLVALAWMAIPGALLPACAP